MVLWEVLFKEVSMLLWLLAFPGKSHIKAYQSRKLEQSIDYLEFLF